MSESRNLQLHQAVTNGDINTVRTLLDDGADVNFLVAVEKDPGYFTTPLRIAAELGYVEIIELLIQRGAEVTPRNLTTYSPLRGATYHEKINAVAALLKAGADPDQANAEGNTSLSYTTRLHDNPELINVLINGGASIDLPSDHGFTPLAYAIFNGHINAVKALVKAGANVNLLLKTPDNDHLFTALVLAAQNGQEEIVDFLLQHQAVVDFPQPNIMSALRTAAFAGHTKVVMLLLSARADVNNQNTEGETPLITAIQGANLTIVKMLIAAGADVNLRNNAGATPLIYAAAIGQREILEYLLTLNIDEDAAVNQKNIALFAAAIFNHPECIHALLDHHTNIEGRSDNDVTPLMMAAVNGKVESVQALLARGANIDAKDNQDRTALQLAKIAHQWNVVNVLTNSFQYRLEKIGYHENIPDDFICPISQEIMNDPVAVSSGHTYDRSSLIDLFEHAGNPDQLPCPLTRKMIQLTELTNDTHVITKKFLAQFVNSKEEAAAAEKLKLAQQAAASSVTEHGLFPARNETDEKDKLAASPSVRK